MARSIQSNTVRRIKIAREHAPQAFGPMLGELAVHFNISAGMVATITKAHQQTVLRWFFGQSEMSPHWIKASLRLFGVMMWMMATKQPTLEGDVPTRLVKLTRYLREFEQLADSVA